MPKSEGARCVDQHNVERSTEPAMLETVVKNDDVGAASAMGHVRCPRAIRIRHGDDTRAATSNQTLFIVCRFVGARQAAGTTSLLGSTGRS